MTYTADVKHNSAASASVCACDAAASELCVSELELYVSELYGCQQAVARR